MADIHDVADFMIVRMAEAGEVPSAHRLHKLIYFAQGWHLALNGGPLINARFRAWSHGPINLDLIERFKAYRSLYCGVSLKDVRAGFSFDALTVEERSHIDSILHAYAAFPTFQLMEISCAEPAWIEARAGLPLAQASDQELREDIMQEYFRTLGSLSNEAEQLASA
jgi:uncharacterized phage-associated protein